MRQQPGSDLEARCCMCRKTFKPSTLGHLALESHMKSAKHKSHALHNQPPIAQFCTAAQPPNAPVSTSASNLTTVESHQHRPSQTLRAEVIWILKTIRDHHSYSSNEGISKLFKAMFSDSEIAATFTSGKHKIRAGSIHYEGVSKRGQRGKWWIH